MRRKNLPEDTIRQVGHVTSRGMFVTVVPAAGQPQAGTWPPQSRCTGTLIVGADLRTSSG